LTTGSGIDELKNEPMLLLLLMLLLMPLMLLMLRLY